MTDFGINTIVQKAFDVVQEARAKVAEARKEWVENLPTQWHSKKEERGELREQMQKINLDAQKANPDDWQELEHLKKSAKDADDYLAGIVIAELRAGRNVTVVKKGKKITPRFKVSFSQGRLF